MSMTENAANIAVSNQSLGMLGADEIVLNGSSQNHTYVTTFFDDARDEILAAHRWNFATKHAYAVQTTDPLFKWDNAFTKPTDCIKVWGIEEAPDALWEVKAGLILTNEGTAASDWETATDYLVGQYVSNDDVTYVCIVAHTSGDTDDEPGTGAIEATYWTSQSGDYEILKVEYVYQRTDVDAWPISARQCLVINLARMISAPIKQNENASLTLQAMLYGSKTVTGYLSLARTFDAQESGIMSVTTRTLLTSRRTRRGYYD